MYGIEAINAANGWSLAALGIGVVFSSLIVLSLIISQLHKLLNLWDKRKDLLPKKTGSKIVPEEYAEIQESKKSEPDFTAPVTCQHTYPEDIGEIIDIWAPVAEKLDEPFQLADLYKIAAEHDLPHPHLTINRLRRENILIPVEDQKYTFRSEQQNA